LGENKKERGIMKRPSRGKGVVVIIRTFGGEVLEPNGDAIASLAAKKVRTPVYAVNDFLGAQN